MTSVSQPRPMGEFPPPRCPQCNCLSARVVQHDVDGVVTATHMCTLNHLWLVRWAPAV